MAQAAFQKLVEDGIIIRACSGWCSILHFVLKPDKSWRPVGDYRQLNAATEKDVYPLPLIQNFTAELHEKRIFTKIDLTNAFWQVPVNPADVPKTTITTPFGSFQFLRMNYGVINSSATF